MRVKNQNEKRAEQTTRWTTKALARHVIALCDDNRPERNIDEIRTLMWDIIDRPDSEPLNR